MYLRTQEDLISLSFLLPRGLPLYSVLFRRSADRSFREGSVLNTRSISWDACVRACLSIPFFLIEVGSQVGDPSYMLVYLLPPLPHCKEEKDLGMQGSIAGQTD